ncbi:uncharacterized protein N7459_009826 [Penicillium hispanicum]|uniref:uncharacterized protein n=1 Tax=Penicillium hispanicum TaxID=1080232 RepID=UPI002540EB17|nr:uncharacterized protein N7459_009826 [Penicillium hispanicum]KAJ5570396.1 hypothetical protein N7459_009826 [Penicillium hispanicum]
MGSLDLLRYQLYNLTAEARARRTSAPSSAPPPYSYLRPEMTTYDPIDIIMEDPAWDPQWDEPTPVNILIDNSVEVIGNGNKVILPSRAGSPTVGKPPADAESDDDTASSSTSSPPSTKKPRVNPVTQIAATIVAVLRQAGALTDEQGRLRPINVSVKTGVKVHGCNNMFSTQEPVPRPVFPCENTGAGSKRRASSEPPASPPPRKRREMKKTA